MKLMNQFILVVLLGVVSITVNSCSKGKTYTCASCKTTPDALAANDNSYKGIYKGVVVGSSGTIEFNIANSDSTVTAVMIIDGITVNLTATYSIVGGAVTFTPFVGTLNGQAVSINFTLGLTGSNPTVTSVNIPGHPNAVLSIFKETSNSQVVCFEGTFSGTSSGVFNMALSTSVAGWTIIAKDNTKTTSDFIQGTVSNNQISCTGCSPASVTGTLSGDQVNGNWSDGTGGSGSWTGNKTL